MKTLIPLCDIAGLAVESAALEGDLLVISFDDGTFVAFLHDGPRRMLREICVQEFAEDIVDAPRLSAALVRANVMTADERRKIIALAEADERRRTEHAERREYARLKAKFDPPQPDPPPRPWWKRLLPPC